MESIALELYYNASLGIHFMCYESSAFPKIMRLDADEIIETIEYKTRSTSIIFEVMNECTHDLHNANIIHLILYPDNKTKT